MRDLRHNARGWKSVLLAAVLAGAGSVVAPAQNQQTPPAANSNTGPDAPAQSTPAGPQQAPAANKSGASKGAAPTQAPAQANSQAPAPSDNNAFPEAQSEAAQKKAQANDDSSSSNAFPEAASEAAEKKANGAGDGAGSGPPPSNGEPYSSSRSRDGNLNDLLGTGDSAVSDGAGHFINNPKLGKEDIRVGKFYMAQGNYAGAYMRLKESTQVAPGNVEAVYLLAQAARKTSHLDEAEANFKLYLQVEPTGKYAKDSLKALKELAGK